MTPEMIARIRCHPPGSVGTALDVELDRPPERRCGMCQSDATGRKLGTVCPHCNHRFDWFQLLTEVTAVGDVVKTERALAAYQARYLAKKQERDARGDGAWGDPGE